MKNVPKRNYFQIECQTLIEEKIGFTLLFIDIDDLKKLNHSLGYEVGDEWLKIVINNIGKTLSKDERIYKWEGDEFIVLLREINLEHIKHRIYKILEILNRSYEIRKQQVELSASIGVAFYPLHGVTVSDLVKRADMAMQYAKKISKNTYILFQESIERDINYKIEMENDLKKAIKNKEFLLHYQPQFCCKDLSVYGMEALIRWNHPNKGIILPMEFIPLAEETGLIKEIGKWVIEEAFKQCKRWEDKGHNIKLSVNISPVQLKNSGFIDNLKENLNSTGINVNNIILEVTESTGMDFIKSENPILSEIQKMGIKIALDDFGIGYSSLAYFKKLPIDIVKIDKLFIDNINSKYIDKAIVDGIIHICKKIKVDVIAEGVEQKEQLNLLKENGCDIIQGYLLGKPMELKNIDNLLEGMANYEIQKIKHKD